MRIQSVRVARQTDRLEDVVAFYRDVIGLPVIGDFEDHAGYTGVILGLPGDHVHLEFTTHVHGSPGSPGEEDDLIVLYVDPAGLARVVARARTTSLTPLDPANPYWSSVGAVTLADPDGRRIVLVPR